MVCFGWLKNDSHCLLLQHSSKCYLLVDERDWDLIKKIVCTPETNKRIMHWCESCSGTATLKKFLDQELKEHEDDQKFNDCQWNTTDQAILTTITATYKEYGENLIDVIDDLTRHSYIAKIKITSS